MGISTSRYMSGEKSTVERNAKLISYLKFPT